MIKAPQFRFIVKKGPNIGHIYPVFAEKITIGRDPMSDIIFKDPEVSRRHVQFIREGHNYVIEDLGSTNGTFIDGERLVGQQFPLKIGQEIALGGAITLIFASEDNGVNSGEVGETPDLENSIYDSQFAVETTDHEEPYDEYRLEDLQEFDKREGKKESFQFDRRHSSTAKPDKSFPHTPIPQSSRKSPEALPLPRENARTFTSQQIIYLVIGTAVTTMIACGIISFLFYVIVGR